MKKISILEPGAWGTALGILLSKARRKTFGCLRGKKNEVRFWYEDKKLALKIDRFRENEKLPGIKIPEKISISSHLKEIIKDADLIIIASPSFNFRKTLLKLKGFENLPPLLGVAKGIEKETLKLPSQIVEEIFAPQNFSEKNLGGLSKISYAHLSGPGFAREIVSGKPAKEVIASRNSVLLKKLKKIFQIEPLKILTTTDLMGVQLAGAIKNSLAIGISLVEAGSHNPVIKKIRSKLIKISLEEMIKIGEAMGAKKETFLGPAGLGDLILTSTNPLSRNFQFGKNLYFNAEKMRQDIKERKITVEGLNNTWALYKLGKIHKLKLPMINETYKLIYKKTSPEKTIKNLLELTKMCKVEPYTS